MVPGTTATFSVMFFKLRYMWGRRGNTPNFPFSSIIRLGYFRRGNDPQPLSVGGLLISAKFGYYPLLPTGIPARRKIMTGKKLSIIFFAAIFCSCMLRDYQDIIFPIYNEGPITGYVNQDDMYSFGHPLQ